MFENVPFWLYIMDLFGTFIFALTGGFRAIKYEMDLLGVVSLATVVGVGGGITRDVLLGATPPFALRSADYLIVTSVAGAGVFFFARSLALRWRFILYADALGLGLFAAIGAARAAYAGLGLVGIMVVAAIASVGGGIIRDMLTGEIPTAFQKDIYASAALTGGFIYWVLNMLGVSGRVPFTAALIVTFLLRAVTMKWNLHLPRSKRLPVSPSEMSRHMKNEREKNI